MKKILLLSILLLIVSNMGKPDYTLKIKAISELKPIELDYRNTITTNVFYALPQLWFWKKNEIK